MTPKVMVLAPADWRQLCLLNVAQLHQIIESIPANDEHGASGLTDEMLAVLDQHVAKGAALLIGWRKSRVPGLAHQQAPRAEQTASAAKTNGHDKPKPRRGGWPLGKKRGPRKPRPETGAVQ